MELAQALKYLDVLTSVANAQALAADKAIAKHAEDMAFNPIWALERSGDLWAHAANKLIAVRLEQWREGETQADKALANVRRWLQSDMLNYLGRINTTPAGQMAAAHAAAHGRMIELLDRL